MDEDNFSIYFVLVCLTMSAFNKNYPKSDTENIFPTIFDCFWTYFRSSCV